MDRIDALEELKKKLEKKDLEKFIRKIVKDEVEKLLNAKYDSENTLSVQEVIEKYKTSLSTINRYVNDNILKCNQTKTKGRRLFKKADCDAVFLKEKK